MRDRQATYPIKIYFLVTSIFNSSTRSISIKMIISRDDINMMSSQVINLDRQHSSGSKYEETALIRPRAYSGTTHTPCRGPGFAADTSSSKLAPGGLKKSQRPTVAPSYGAAKTTHLPARRVRSVPPLRLSTKAGGSASPLTINTTTRRSSTSSTPPSVPNIASQPLSKPVTTSVTYLRTNAEKTSFSMKGIKSGAMRNKAHGKKRVDMFERNIAEDVLNQSPPPPPMNLVPSLAGDCLWLTAASKISSASARQNRTHYTILDYDARLLNSRRRRQRLQDFHVEDRQNFRMKDFDWIPSPDEPKRLRFYRIANPTIYDPEAPPVELRVL